jgi:hypothetical protein
LLSTGALSEMLITSAPWSTAQMIPAATLPSVAVPDGLVTFPA